MVRKDFLPPFSPYIGEEEISEVVDTLKSDWITMGPKTLKFEELFKEYIGCKFAISLNSCTAGLHLSLVSLNIGEGSEVITSPYTFAATGNTIVHQRAKPIFVDIDKGTYNIDIEQIENAITDKTRAIMPVHYAGHPCEMNEILKIADEYNLYVIEDAAHALGAKYKGKEIGTIGDTTSFSFYATKNITTGEGGMVTTDNEEIAEKIRILRLHGISRDAWKRYSSEGSWYYEIIECGYKYNMTDIQASIGIHQLKKAEAMRKKREEIAKIYNEEFENLEGLITPTIKKHVKHAWHLYPLLIDIDRMKINRNKFIEELKKQNIGTSVHFIPLHLHPFYRKTLGYKKGDFPSAEWVYEREISLPIYPRMTDDDVIDVVNAVKKIVLENR